MFDLVLKNAQVYDGESFSNNDLAISQGRIAEMAPKITDVGYKTIDLSGRYLSKSLFDLHSHSRFPGADENALSKINTAAILGGYSHVVFMPNTDPVIDNPIVLRDTIANFKNSLCIYGYQLSAMSKNLDGLEMVDYVLMLQNGAAGFSDDGRCVQDSALMKRIIAYLSGITKHSPIFLAQHLEDYNLTENGVINEGQVSDDLGLAGMDPRAESVILARDLLLIKNANIRYHAQHVSTKESIEIIKFARKKGVKCSAEVTPHHLMFNESALHGYKTNCKINPPLRSETDRRSLIEAVLDGTINVVATDHAPHPFAKKNTTLNGAAFGTVGLETAMSAVFTVLKNEIGPGAAIKTCFDLMSFNPRKVFRTHSSKLKVGSNADLVVFDDTKSYVVNDGFYQTRPNNSAYLGSKLEGKVEYLLIHGNLLLEEGEVVCDV